MATRADIDALLTLELRGHAITPEKFLKGTKAFFGILTEVTKSVCEDQARVRWSVQVKSGSNLIGVVPEPGFSPAIVASIARAVGTGIHDIENAPAEPEHFSPQAIRHLHDLAGIAGTDDRDDTTIRVWVRKEHNDVTRQSVAHLAELLSGAYSDYGSIEGRIQVASQRRGMHFVVYDPLWDRPVRCHNLSDDQIDLALKNFGSKVEVSGLIRYRRDGTPVSIDVDDILPFPADEDIPSYLAVHGILRDA